MKPMRMWAIMMALVGATPLASLGCSGASPPPLVFQESCCDYAGGAWSCAQDCNGTSYCPVGVSYQERCTSSGTDAPTCSKWACDDAGPPLGGLPSYPTFGSDAADVFAPAEAGLDAAVDQAAEAGIEASVPPEVSTVDAGTAETESAGPCVPDEPCDGISQCSVACYGPTCCQLSCSCEGPYGVGAPDDPSARLACVATCP
jgi:hypothetical protein